MHDAAPGARPAVIGLSTHPDSTLADRALLLLRDGAQGSDRLARDVMGLVNAPRAVADRLAVALLGADPRVVRLPDGRWALAAAAAGSPLIEDCAFAVVDVETTGSRSAGSDRVTEVAVVVVQGVRCEVVFDSLVNPERPLPPIVTAITGITSAMVAGAPTFGELADDVMAALAGRIFVAHNARFDWGFLRAEVRRARGLALDGTRLCTVRLARRLLRPIESCSLDSLMHHFGIENPARHRAAGDALATARLLSRLLDLARDKGARTVQDLETLQARGRRRKKKDRTTPSIPSVPTVPPVLPP